MTDEQFTSLSLSATRSVEQEAYIFYITLDGVQVELMRRKLGGLDTDRRNAADAAQQTTTPAEQPQPQQ